MKRNNFFKIIFFIVLLLPTISTLNGMGWGWDPGGGGDTTPPYVSFYSPGSGATIYGTIDITVIATDSGGMDKVKFYIGTIYIGTVLEAEASGNYYTLEDFDTTAYSDGGYTLKAYAYDDAQNVAGTQRNIYIDNTGDYTNPIISMFTPAAGTTLDGLDGDLEETLTVIATDSKSGMDRVEFLIGSTPIETNYYDGDSTFTVIFDFSDYEDGPYTLIAKAYDNYENMAQETREVYIETSGKPIASDPDPITHPSTETYDWLNDAARHPSNPIMISMARRATGYGIRKMTEDLIDMTGWTTKQLYTRAISRFIGDFLGTRWNGDDNSKDDLTVASLFDNFYSWMDVTDYDLGLAKVDCRDAAAFATGMAMAMGLKARMISSENGPRRHVAAEIYDGETRNYGYYSTDWYIMSLFGAYVDALSPISSIQGDLTGPSTQYVYHIISYIDHWNIPVNDYPFQETGWVGWYNDCPDPNDPYSEYWDFERDFYYYSIPGYFAYYSNDPYGIDCSYSYPDLPGIYTLPGS